MLSLDKGLGRMLALEKKHKIDLRLRKIKKYIFGLKKFNIDK